MRNIDTIDPELRLVAALAVRLGSGVSFEPPSVSLAKRWSVGSTDRNAVLAHTAK
jgi:hypothetical protein